MMKKLSAPLAVLGALFILTGCATTPVQQVATHTPTSTATEAPVTPSTSTPTSTPAPTASTSTVALLDALTVDDTPHPGYDRSLFNHWITNSNGCDTRENVLAREVINGTTTNCDTTGTWVSLYDNVTTTDPGTFDIDHMVPLAEAWQSGAYTWGSYTREEYANDLGYPYSLVAVSATSNRSKSDKDPANWMPPTMDGCEYVARWVAVKYRWNLTVDTAERNKILSVLSWCGGDYNLPETPTYQQTTETTTPSTTPAEEPVTNTGGTDPKFSTCKEANSNGYGPYTKGVNPEYDWYRDGDKDGTVCE